MGHRQPVTVDTDGMTFWYLNFGHSFFFFFNLKFPLIYNFFYFLIFRLSIGKYGTYWLNLIEKYQNISFIEIIHPFAHKI